MIGYRLYDFLFFCDWVHKDPSVLIFVFKLLVDQIFRGIRILNVMATLFFRLQVIKLISKRVDEQTGHFVMHNCDSPDKLT
jgi:hypothetical protein